MSDIFDGGIGISERKAETRIHVSWVQGENVHADMTQGILAVVDYYLYTMGVLPTIAQAALRYAAETLEENRDHE